MTTTSFPTDFATIAQQEAATKVTLRFPDSTAVDVFTYGALKNRLEQEAESHKHQPATGLYAMTFVYPEHRIFTLLSLQNIKFGGIIDDDLNPDITLVDTAATHVTLGRHSVNCSDTNIRVMGCGHDEPVKPVFEREFFEAIKRG